MNTELFGYESNIAYKLPFRGNNYKFSHSFNYHILGKAYTKSNVHNCIVEALNLSEDNCSGINFKIVKSSRQKFGSLKHSVKKKEGYYCYFITPTIQSGNKLYKNKHIKIFRKRLNCNKNGKLKNRNKVKPDYETMSRFIMNIKTSANLYNLEIKKVVFNRYLLKDLYKSKTGEILKKEDVYFAKYLSNKINKRFDNIFYVEFKKKK